MNNKVQKVTVAIVAVIVFLATFFGSTREQVVVEAKKIVTDSNNINNDYLIGIQSLDNALGAQGLVILDIRSKKEYNEGHIPGAINVSWNQFVDNNSNDNSSNNSSNTNSNSNINNEISNAGQESSNSNNGQESVNVNPSNINEQELSSYTTNWISSMNKNTLTKELQSLGITNQSTVVIYGDSNGDDLGELGKFSWMFRMVGIQSKMLNGGYKNWVSQGFTTTTQVPKIEKSNMVIQNFEPIKTIKKPDIAKNISKIKILELVNDVKNQNVDLQSGATTGSVNNSNNAVVQNTENSTSTQSTTTSGVSSNVNNQNNVQLKTEQQDTQIDPPVTGVIQIKLSDMLNPNGTIKPVDQLQNFFDSKGIKKNDIVLFYNTNKGNLAFLTLMLNMAGYNNIQTYNANLEQVVNITTAILQAEKNSNNEQTANTGSQQISGNGQLTSTGSQQISGNGQLTSAGSQQISGNGQSTSTGIQQTSNNEETSNTVTQQNKNVGMSSNNQISDNNQNSSNNNN